ncbi:MAG: GGDEF domain-containing protein, partial [Comamonas sp.]
HRSLRENLPLAVILIDMDHFSRVNKRHGYQTGDEALQLMSRTLQKQMRGDELVARWQGESFCLLLHADQIGARALLTRIKSAIQMGAQYELQVDLDFSAGCALAPSAWKGLKLDELTKQADIALQQAKKLGRGRTEFITLTPPSQDGAESTLSSGA